MNTRRSLICDRGFNSVTSTSVSFSMPSTRRGISSSPSALTKLITAAAPLSRGVATSLPPTSPRATRTNSFALNEEVVRRVRIAFTFSGAGHFSPVSFARRGFTTRVKTIYAETGYPGTPTTGLPSISPSMVGLPGLIARP